MATDVEQLMKHLHERGVLVAAAPGIYYQGSEFQRIRQRVAATLRSMWTATVDIAVNTPPILPLDSANRTGYIGAFPHLVLVCKSGTEEAHSILLRNAADLSDSDTSWSDSFNQGEYVLTPAACHGVYPLVPGLLPQGGFRAEAFATCSRHESTVEPGRFRSFDMLELVQIGTPSQIESFVEEFAPAAREILNRFGLLHELVSATDPFFLGERMARLLEESDTRKREFVIQFSEGQVAPIAVASINDHGRHFTESFGISDSTESAVSACIAFGLERIVLGLYGHHGVEVRSWPDDILKPLRVDFESHHA